MPGYFAPSSPIFLTPLLEPPPRSVRLSTASIRRSNDAASNSTLLPENLDSFTPTFKKQDNLASSRRPGDRQECVWYASDLCPRVTRRVGTSGECPGLSSLVDLHYGRCRTALSR